MRIIQAIITPLPTFTPHYGAAVSLHTAFQKYSADPEILKQQSLNAHNMAEALFDREATYQELADFILSP